MRFGFFVGYIFSILINLQLKRLWFLVMSFIWFIAPTCFKALLLLQHHNNMLSSIIHARFWLIAFSFLFLLWNCFSESNTIGGNQLWWHGGISWRKMYPNFVKEVVISSSGVGFMSTNLDELLARSNLSSILEVMLPSSVKGMKVFLANVTYKVMW